MEQDTLTAISILERKGDCIESSSGNHTGIIFVIRPNRHVYYGVYVISQMAKQNVFNFHGFDGYGASASINSLRIDNVRNQTFIRRIGAIYCISDCVSIAPMRFLPHI